MPVNYRRLFFFRKDLHMSTGKLLAQLGHCAEGFWTRALVRSAHRDGDVYRCQVDIPAGVFDGYVASSFVKTVCEARNKNHLLKAKAIAEEMKLIENVDFGLIYDNCRTELTPEEPDGTTLTGIWFRPLPDEEAHKISEKYQLYR